MSAYFDTSALVKLVLREPESGAVAGWWDGADDAFASTVGYVELHAAVARAGRDGRVTATAVSGVRADVDGLWRRVVTVGVDAAVVARAGELAVQHALAALDAIHLASASAVADATHPVRFISFDRRLREAAVAEGFTVLPEAT